MSLVGESLTWPSRGVATCLVFVVRAPAGLSGRRVLASACVGCRGVQEPCN